MELKNATSKMILELEEIQKMINDNDFTFINDTNDLVACKELVSLFIKLKFEGIYEIILPHIQKMEKYLPNDLHELITKYGDWRWYQAYLEYFKIRSTLEGGNNYKLYHTSPTNNTVNGVDFPNYWIEENN